MRLFEIKMKGGSDFNKFMGYKGKDLADPNNRKVPKILNPNLAKAKPKLGPKVDDKDYYYEEITLDEDQDFEEHFGILGYSIDENDMFEAEYQGRTVKLNKPMRGDVKKFKVYVKNKKGNVIKVNFGHGGTSAKRKTMRIRKSNPKARKSFRARHNCDNPGPKTKARYWSCRKW
tara:strand:+ start:159 stop:680 length:522 start_codon:yes stop_codon:yes gene_type:complete